MSNDLERSLKDRIRAISRSENRAFNDVWKSLVLDSKWEQCLAARLRPFGTFRRRLRFGVASLFTPNLGAIFKCNEISRSTP